MTLKVILVLQWGASLFMIDKSNKYEEYKPRKFPIYHTPIYKLYWNKLIYLFFKQSKKMPLSALRVSAFELTPID